MLFIRILWICVLCFCNWHFQSHVSHQVAHFYLNAFNSRLNLLESCCCSKKKARCVRTMIYYKNSNRCEMKNKSKTATTMTIEECVCECLCTGVVRNIVTRLEILLALCIYILIVYWQESSRWVGSHIHE